MTRLRLILPCLLLASIARAAAPAAAPALDPAATAFFETKIRPVLVEQCYSCHSAAAEKVKGKLWLDSRAALLKGGDSGEPAVVPGQPDKSKLIVAIRYKDEDLQMPPKGKKLPPAVIADFEAWVRMGAPDPRTGDVTAGAAPGPAAPDHLDIAAAKKQWAFQVPREPAVPKIADPALASWVKTPIDAFIAAKLAEKGLHPTPPADKRTLLRRATFDLTGLPPTPAEYAAFEADASPNAFAAVVERLLADPHYGERWGRYWLDVARYADSKGYVFEEARSYAFSYAYRDWVMRAFNEDLPYDQFLLQQIAADQLPLGDDHRPLAAMGFLTIGRRFLNSQPDIIDDRLDVVFRGTQGLTVACARCHDHKYDPIPTKDYYGLYGVFASSTEPKELPLVTGGPKPPAPSPQTLDYERQNAALETQFAALRTKQWAAHVAALRTPAAIKEYLLTWQELSATPEAAIHEAIRATAVKKSGTLSAGGVSQLLYRWRATVSASPDTPAGLVFAPWRALAALPPAQFAQQAPALARRFAADAHLPAPLAAAFATPPASLDDLAGRYANVLASASAPRRRWLPGLADYPLARLVALADLPYDVPQAQAEMLFNAQDNIQLRNVRKQIDQLATVHPGSVPRAMVLQDLPQPVTPHVFLRGSAGNVGPEVPRAFLAVLSPQPRPPFQHGSGRLELAQAIASKSNPLTARVMVNRVWLHHFGFGLVRTPSDFGARGEPPTHPELLDYLACHFMEEGWSIKKLHRAILLSSTYQQGSGDVGDDDSRQRQVDPENKLLWRQNRQRLDFEGLRDSLLAASGQLDATVYGRPVDILTAPFSHRRTVYGYVDRNNLPGLYRTFDFASPDATSPMRFSTTVPQQALFLMNAPFVVEQARALAARPEVTAAAEPAKKVEAMYRVLFGRAPTADETKLAVDYVASESARGRSTVAVESSQWRYGYGEYDPAAGAVKTFHPLAHFTGTVWQAGPKLPDRTVGWASLTAGGGHPGHDQQHATIRRWVAPRDGALSIAGTFRHTQINGDGVRGRIAAGGQERGTWVVARSGTPTDVPAFAVKRGDAVDFVVDCRADENSDSYSWHVQLRLDGEVGRTEWDSTADFAGAPPAPAAPISPWEKYAQVLLESNEFVFVD